jgi:streptogramin lyase
MVPPLHRGDVHQSGWGPNEGIELEEKQMKHQLIVLLSVVAFAASCGDNEAANSQTQQEFGEAIAAVTAPPNAKCIVLTVKGTTTVTSQYNVSPGQSSTLNVSGLPIGAATVSASAYNFSCASISGKTATYVSDPVSVTVSATPIKLTLQMRLASGGSGTVSVNFPNPPGMIAEFTIPWSSLPEQMTTGPDGNIWFTDDGPNSIVQVFPDGSMLSYPIPTSNSTATGITAGPDGNIWFTESGSDKIGRLAIATGTFVEYGVPTASAGPGFITTGPDGNLWFTEGSADQIGRMTTSGSITEFALAQGARPLGIVGGADGNIWFVENAANKIGRMTPSGSFTEFAIPTANAQPWSIVVGADGNLWFAEYPNNKVGKVTPTGTFTEYPLATANANPWFLIPGNDGTVWFTEHAAQKVGSITTAGVITEIAAAAPLSILAFGADGNLWLPEVSVNKIARITP